MSSINELLAIVYGGGDDAVKAVQEYLEKRGAILESITDTFLRPTWIPVNERLPEVGVTVLGWDRDGYHTLHVYCGKGKSGTDVWFSSNVAGGEYEDARSGSAPAFWMPLPTSPKASQ